MEFFIIIALAFGAMWLMTNRTRKQQRAAGDFRANLEIGNEVMTGSGLYGTIVDIEGDTITLESTPGNETRWIRAAISKLVDPPVEETAESDEDELDEDEGDEYETDEYESDDEYDDDDVEYEADDAATEGEVVEYEGDDVARPADVVIDDADDSGDVLYAERPTDARSDVDRPGEPTIQIPDDLSTLPPTRPEDDTDKK